MPRPLHHVVTTALGALLVSGLAAGPVAPSAGAAEEPAPVATSLKLAAPARVVDERSVTLTATWITSPPVTDPVTPSEPVAQGLVRFQRLDGKRWRTQASRRTDAAGVARLVVTPRSDTTWRVAGVAGATWRGALSGVRRIDNQPPGTRVSLPGPKPRGLPAQARATGPGARAVVTGVPHQVWRSMKGRSWRPGCPVGRASLRLVRVNYWGFDGYRYRGELVVSSAIARRAAAAFSVMHDRKLPIRRMYRVDRFGFNKRLNGADDYASMRADNTSGFNCRWVVNRPGVRSPHASGRAIDINPWENPYRSATGWVPNSWWSAKAHPRVAWRSSAHPVVTIWRNHGFRWTYGSNDSQHYDGRQAPVLRGGFVG
jgi:hypothetical protein